MSFTQKINYYWKMTSWNRISKLNYEYRRKEIEKLENELKEDKELTQTDKRFINCKVISPVKEFLQIK